MKAAKLGILIFVILFIGIFVLGIIKDKGTGGNLISPLSDIIENIPGIPHSHLKETIEDSMNGALGDYAIVVKNLKTGESYSLDTHKVFDTGSLYKLWVMAVVYQDIRDGKFAKNQILSEDVSVLNNKFGINFESAELTSGTITLSVGGALSQMITISSNYSAYLLTEKIGLSSVAAFLKKEDFNDSRVGTDGGVPITSVYDIASFFEKLYKGELISKSDSSQILELLKKQQLNNKLPRNLPSGTIIAHKTGEIDYYSHDGGIVFGPKSDYLIVVLSKSNYPPGAEERIAAISKAVYDYFEQ